MLDQVRDAYDANAELYASLFRHEPAKDGQSLRLLARLAALADGPVIDVGCGAGTVVNHLAELGVDVRGIDLSAGQIDQARSAFPAHRFEIGDLTALDVADGSLGGLTSRYSVIHLPPDRLGSVLQEWRRTLGAGAPLFLAFFGARSPDGHAEAFDHKVVTAYALWPARVRELLVAAGFVRIEMESVPIPEGGRPFDHVTVLTCAGT